MGKELWRDSVDENFYLKEMGCRTACFGSDAVEMGGVGALLNTDIPALMGALAEHLGSLENKDLLMEGVNKVIGLITPNELAKLLEENVDGNTVGTLLMIRAMLVAHFPREKADTIFEKIVRLVLFS